MDDPSRQQTKLTTIILEQMPQVNYHGPTPIPHSALEGSESGLWVFKLNLIYEYLSSLYGSQIVCCHSNYLFNALKILHIPRVARKLPSRRFWAFWSKIFRQSHSQYFISTIFASSLTTPTLYIQVQTIPTHHHSLHLRSFLSQFQIY